MRVPGSISALLLLAARLAAAQPFVFDDVYAELSQARDIREVEISPDGSQAAWVEQGYRIVVADLNRHSDPRWAAAGTAVRWSPDSNRLAFLSDRDSPGQPQLFILDPAGGNPVRLTNLKGYLAEPRWSPDGKTVAILFTENAPRAAGPLKPVTPESGVVGERIYNQRITTVSTGAKAVRQVSPAALYVHEYDWSPDGKSFAATAAPGPGDNNWYIAKLYTIDSSTGRATAIVTPKLQIAAPRWSPDGRSIAYVGGLMSDEGATGGDVFVVPSGGGEPKNLTPGMDASATGIEWRTDGRILAPEFIDGEAGFALIDPVGGGVRQLWRGPGVVSRNGSLAGASFSRDGGASAVIRQSFSAPPEVWAGAIGEWRQISKANGNARGKWGEGRSLHWMSEGRQVQGWLLYPAGYAAGRRWPMVVWVHGGPAGMASSHWPASDVPGMLAAAGYFVLFPNPRGSFGSGEAFTAANVRDFGYGDFRDILAGVDEVVKTLPVDNSRIGIAGWSYGGYMSMWAVTQTRRFAAAVAGAGLANWLSYYGENQIDQWMIPYFGASAYDDPAVYERSSPITFIKNAKTPTLIVVGDRDAECPPPQSWEFWHALKTLGVDTRLVIYPNEGHAIGEPEHQRDIVRRTLDWFAQYMKPEGVVKQSGDAPALSRKP